MKITERIFDATTGETIDIERDMTEAEEINYSKAQEKNQLFMEQQKTIEEKRIAAEAKLAALGLTADDLRALNLG